MYARHPQLANSLTHRLTPAGERPKGGKAARDRGEKAACGTGPETEERKLPVELAQRQRRESSLWNWSRERKKRESSLWYWPRDRESSMWNWPRDRQKSSLWNWPRESSLWNWPRDRGEKAARDQPEERKQPVCKSSNYIPTCAFRKFIRE